MALAATKPATSAAVEPVACTLKGWAPDGNTKKVLQATSLSADVAPIRCSAQHYTSNGIRNVATLVVSLSAEAERQQRKAKRHASCMLGIVLARAVSLQTTDAFWRLRLNANLLYEEDDLTAPGIVITDEDGDEAAQESAGDGGGSPLSSHKSAGSDAKTSPSRCGKGARLPMPARQTSAQLLLSCNQLEAGNHDITEYLCVVSKSIVGEDKWLSQDFL